MSEFTIKINKHICLEEDNEILCDLSFQYKETMLLRNIDSMSHKEKDSVIVGVLPLAWWLADNFWRICYEPHLPSARSLDQEVLEDWEIAHNMLAIGDGFAWPNITFFSAGNFERIVVRAQDEKRHLAQQARYCVDADCICPKDEFVSAILDVIKKAFEWIGDDEPDFRETCLQLFEMYNKFSNDDGDSDVETDDPESNTTRC